MKESKIEIIIERAKEKFPDARPRIISDNGPRFIFLKADIAKCYAVPSFTAETHVDRSIDDPTPFVENTIFGAFQLVEASRKYLACPDVGL